jgi:hypothetical protein
MKIFSIIKKIISYQFILLNWIIFKIKKPKTLIILGMHRSGTSCITRILNQNGLSLGKELIQPDTGNPQGYWENLAVYWINERILKKSNGTWDNPPQQFLSNIYIHLEIMRIFYNRDWNNPHLIIKDPRMVLTWDVWKKHLKNYQILAVFRNPDSVAKSLNRRDDMKLENGLKLWEIYNQKILDIYKTESMYFLNFDNEYSFNEKITDLLEKLGFEFIPESLEFYNPSFKTSDKFDNNTNEDIYKELLCLEKG